MMRCASNGTHGDIPLSTTKSGKRRLPLPKRFNVAMTEEAYAALRALNARYGFGNNYCLTFLLENLDAVADAGRLEAMYQAKVEEFGRPANSAC